MECQLHQMKMRLGVARVQVELSKSAMQVLQNKEEANRIYDMLAEQKLTIFFKDTVKLSEKEIAYEKFVELASK